MSGIIALVIVLTNHPEFEMKTWWIIGVAVLIDIVLYARKETRE